MVAGQRQPFYNRTDLNGASGTKTGPSSYSFIIAKFIIFRCIPSQPTWVFNHYWAVGGSGFDPKLPNDTTFIGTVLVLMFSSCIQNTVAMKVPEVVSELCEI